MSPGESHWAWLGDMELDDTLLGLGAAGVFPGPPLAIGFLVNAAHCAEKPAAGQTALKASAMFQEKLDFLETFFSGSYFAVLDRYAGGKVRGDWVGALSAQELNSLKDACGFEDELPLWVRRVVAARPATLHLLLSGPLLGRGRELCQALRDQLPEARIIFWTYSGSFNLTHTSEEDRESLRELAAMSRVSMVETTIKSGSWLCEMPRPFWGEACPTAWTLEDAKRNPIGFNMSTDIQSINMFLEEYSSADQGGRGLPWILQQIAQDRGDAVQATNGKNSVAQLLQEMEIRSLTTNLTKMVNPTSSSMSKVREALPLEQQQELEVHFKRAADLLAAASHDSSPAAAAEANRAAQAYAELYRGRHGDFHEAGSVEYFPKDKPFSGPRLDKRCILRSMAHGKLQGGPTADVLVVLALLLHLHALDPDVLGSVGAAVEGNQAIPVCGLIPNFLNCFSSPSVAPACLRNLPQETKALFRLRPGSDKLPNVLITDLVPGTAMDAETKRALEPLVEATALAAVAGAQRLHAAAAVDGRGAPWGAAPRRDATRRTPY